MVAVGSRSGQIELALFFHVLGAILFAGGAIVAGVAFEAARRRTAPAEVALLLGLARSGAVLLGLGGAVVLGFGLWLVELASVGFGTAWVQAALGLYAAAFVLGGIGSRGPRRARLLAARLARENAR